MKLTTAALIGAQCVLLGARVVFAEAVVPKSVIHVDCSFTGPAGELCKSESLEWGKKRGVTVKVEQHAMTSTEKLRRYSKLLAQKSSEIDVFPVDVIWPSIFHKSLLDLKPYFKDLIPSFAKVYIQNNTLNGRLIAIPFSVSVGLLYYRTDLLTKYKMSPPETWEQLVEIARTIKRAENTAGDHALWGFVFQGKAYEGLSCNALEWIASYNGGTLLDDSGWPMVNTANVNSAMEFAAKIVGEISPREVLHFTETDSHHYFRSGRAVFLRAWPSAWSIINDEQSPVHGRVAVTIMPKGGEHGIHASTLGGWSLAVAQHSAHPELAADLVKYLTGIEAQKRRALLAGQPPTLTELYRDPDILRSAPYAQTMITLLEKAVLRPSRVSRGFYPDVSREL